MLINPEMTIGLSDCDHHFSLRVPLYPLGDAFISAAPHEFSPHALGQPLEHCNACGERNEGMYIAMEPSFV